MKKKKQQKETSEKLFIDKDLCMRCGTCVAMYPDNFQFSEDLSFVEVKDTKELTEEQIAEIIQICPVGAIKKSDEEESD